MDWKDEEVAAAHDELPNHDDTYEERCRAVRAIMTRAVELAAGRGGTMTAETVTSVLNAIQRNGWPIYSEPLRQHISALGARMAVLEAEREDYRNKMELAQEGEAERDRAMHEAQDEVEKLRERLAAAEDGNRELVRRAQQAEAIADMDRKEVAHKQAALRKAWDERDQWQKRADAAEARCAALSAAGQVLSAHVDRQWGSPESIAKTLKDTGKAVEASTRRPCSPTCTHDDAAKPGHPERVKERSEAVKAIGHEDCPDNPCPGHHPYCEGVGKDEPHPRESKAYEAGAEAMRAACARDVLSLLDEVGLWSIRERIKAAIEGAAP